MVKKPSLQASSNRPNITDEQSEALAQRLADKPYGATERLEPEKMNKKYSVVQQFHLAKPC